MKRKALAVILTVLMLVGALTGCREATKVSYNVSKEADNFNVVRKITVINARTDKVVFELTGVFALGNSSANELSIVCQTGENEYKKHYVYLNEWTLYFVEDISGADVSPYRYEITFFPQSIQMFDYEIGGLKR